MLLKKRKIDDFYEEESGFVMMQQQKGTILMQIPDDIPLNANVTKEFATALGSQQRVDSPSFALEYLSRHMDILNACNCLPTLETVLSIKYLTGGFKIDSVGRTLEWSTSLGNPPPPDMLDVRYHLNMIRMCYPIWCVDRVCLHHARAVTAYLAKIQNFPGSFAKNPGDLTCEQAMDVLYTHIMDGRAQMAKSLPSRQNIQSMEFAQVFNKDDGMNE